MSSWGNRDNVLLSGNVTVSTSSNLVQGFGGTVFLDEVDDGDYIVIGGVKNQVFKVTSNTALYLTSNADVNGANVKAYVQQGPKYIHDINDTNVYTIQNVVGVDRTEVEVDTNKDKGFNSPGWSHHHSYVDGYGQTRYKTETLVAMSKNFNANTTGHLAFLDASDDANVADYWLYFTTQPEDDLVTANANVTFQVVAVSDPTGASITYQWQESTNNIVYANVSDGGVYSGATSNTLAISNSAGLANNYYRVVISATGADSNTSTEAQILFV